MEERKQVKDIRELDQLMDNDRRTRTGAFYTPKPWVDMGHKMTDTAFGADWREKFVVFDCASGTGNLTRDYKFSELYSSTLDQADVDVMQANGINAGATVFQYDFLNDDLGAFETNWSLFPGSRKMPDGLYRALTEKKPMVFFINPPYGTAAVKGATGAHKAGTAITGMNQMMKDEGGGQSSQQLYSQFLYRIMAMKELYGGQMNICLFSPALFMAGSSFRVFREQFYSAFDYVDGMFFSAAQFADTADTWGISFTIWRGK